MNQKGSSYLYIILTGLVLLGAFLIYYYFRYLDTLGTTSALPRILVTPSPKVELTADWKQITSGDVSLKYPPDWLVNSESIISQYPYSNRSETNSIYNIVRITKIENQLHPGYLNHEWFDKLYGLGPTDMFNNEFYPSDSIKFQTVEKGTTVGGQRYVIFVASKTVGEQMFAYIPRNDVLYQLTLTKFDSIGLDIFKKIVPTVSLIN